MSSLTLVVILIVQIFGPTTATVPNLNHVLDEITTETIINSNYADMDESQLFQRGLEDPNEDNLIPVLDVSQAVDFFKTISAKEANLFSRIFEFLAKVSKASLLSQVFGYIRHVMDRERDVKDYPGERKSNLYSFTEPFSKESLILSIENLSTTTVATIIELLAVLEKVYRNTAVGPLFSSILEILTLQPNIQKYGKLCKNVDEALGLDKPLDFLNLNLPIPTDAKPVRYFELIDKEHAEVKCLVRVSKDKDSINLRLLVLPKGYVGEDDNEDSYDFTAPYTRQGVEDLYKNLPISKFIKFIKVK